jgi:L-rhamnose mutarotase
MQRVAFTMQLHPGFEEEYRRRHAAIWPELSTLLRDTGIREYSIFLDHETLQLFAYLQIGDEATLDGLPAKQVMQRWWNYMKDIMESNPDHSPVTRPLKEVFYLP